MARWWLVLKKIVKFLMCIITSIVVCIFSFVPVMASADLSREDCIRASEFCEYSCAYTYKNMNLNYSQLIAFEDYCSGYSNCFIVSNVRNEAGDVRCIYYCGNDEITVSNGSSNYNKVYITVGQGAVVTIIKFADGSDTSVTYSSCSISMLSYTNACNYSPWYMYFTGGISSNNIDNNLFFGLTGISDYTFLDSLGNILSSDSSIFSKINSIRDMFRNNFKTKTGVTDDNELNEIITATAVGDLTMLDNYVSDSATKQSLLDSYNTMQSFYNDNFSYDSDSDAYTILNYEPENNVYPYWYVDDSTTNINISNSDSDTNVSGGAYAEANANASVGDIVINNNISENTSVGTNNNDAEDIDISTFEDLVDSCSNFWNLLKNIFAIYPAVVWTCVASGITVVVICRLLGR